MGRAALTFRGEPCDLLETLLESMLNPEGTWRDDCSDARRHVLSEDEPPADLQIVAAEAAAAKADHGSS